MSATHYLNQLNHRYLNIHRVKEDFFWDTYMGLSYDHVGSAQAQTEWTQFLSNGARIEEIRQQIELAEQITDSEEKAQTLTGLQGWLAMFESHALESEQAQSLKAGLIQLRPICLRKNRSMC